MSVVIGAAPKIVYVENPSNPSEQTIHDLVDYIRKLLEDIPPTEAYYGDSPPSHPEDGDLWFNTNDNRLYAYAA
jgi:hypothetical protein